MCSSILHCMKMDVYNSVLPFALKLFIVLNICDTVARNDDLSRKRVHVKHVTDSTCGQSHAVKDELYLFYDGTVFTDPCIITIRNSASRRHSKTCIKLDGIFTYDDNFDCQDNFRFYYGEYPFKNSTNYLSCSGIRREVCNAEKTAYAIFNSPSTSIGNIVFQIKVSTKTKHSKHTATGISDTDKEVSKPRSSRLSQRDLSSRDTTDSRLNSWTAWSPSRSRSWTAWSPSRSRSWTAWSPSRSRSWTAWSPSRSRSWTAWSPSRRRTWTSWSSFSSSSWSSWNEKEKRRKDKTKSGFIALAVIGSFIGAVILGVVCYVFDCCTGGSTTVTNNQTASPEPPREALELENSHLVPGVPERHDGTRTESAMGYAAGGPDDTPTSTSDRENITNGRHQKPSAPPLESAEITSPEAPPPAYSSLFPS